MMIVIGVLALGAGAFGIANLTSTDTPMISSQAHATVQSQTFAIEKMTCATCPITVKKAMRKVEGVKSVSVDFTAKTATANFDPAITDIAAIASASTNAGYPAHATNDGDKL